ncbi:vacuolar protease A [Apiospora aurea]|uniref:Vacuolar protease A n=1 Tax=Apiospora aurea TaxID=335848 RepID=A0ABR1QZ78_9PEZI
MHRIRSLALASALLHTGSAAVLDLPIWYRNTYALVNFQVGTPAQDHLLLFDTGSGTSWLADKKCADDACDNGSGFPRNGYDANASTTSVDLGVYNSIGYLGGATGGFTYCDVFELGGAAWNQTFIAANQSSWSFIPGDGFLGMGFSSIAQPATKTVVETMIEAGLLDEPKFGLYYGKEFEYTGDGPGEGVLTLGGSKEALYVDGAMTWLPVRKDLNGTVYQLWRSTLRKFTGSRRLDGDEDGQPQSYNGTLEWAPGQANGVFDTGASMISVPDGRIAAMYASIGWDYEDLYWGRRVPLCTDFNASWSVAFTFSDDGVHFQDVAITGDRLARNGFAGRADACVPPFDASGSEGLVLFGQSFMRQFYTVYDFGGAEVESYKPLIGFGELKAEFRLPGEDSWGMRQ